MLVASEKPQGSKIQGNRMPYRTNVRRTKVTKFWLSEELLSDEIASENFVRKYNIGTLKARDTASSSISRNRNFVSFVRRTSV